MTKTESAGMQGPSLSVMAHTPMARSSIENVQLDARNGPVPHFERHLTVLKAGYLNFFMERVRIEGTYIEQLKALYKRMKQQDPAFDIGMEYTQARAAWREVRESLDREVQSRTAFCSAINTDVIRPLRELRDTQDRTRQRIYDDMKESHSVYTECAENQLPRAQKLYRRKCQEAEESRLGPTIPMPPNTHQQQHPGMQTTPPTPLFSPTQELFSPPPPAYANLAPEGVNAAPGTGANTPTPNSSAAGLVSTTSRGTEGANNPGRAMSPPPVGNATGPRGAVQDLAQQGKKGLNQLKSFLDSKRDGGGSLREGSERANTALRNVRAKREAEEADKEYRHVVYKLETLRRWRGNVIRAGFTSLEMFMVDLSMELTKALQRYTDTQLATYTTNTQLAYQTQSVISLINPDREILAAHQLIPEHISRILPKRTLYHNYTYGDSSDLIFGFSLLDYAAARNLEDGGVPGVVAKAVKAVDERGLESEGIYRISGRQAIVQDLVHRVEKDETLFEFEKTTDVYCIGSLLKRYLRELPEPLFKFPLPERLQHSAGRQDHIKNGFMILRGKLRRLPGVHQATVRVLVEHLARVAAKSQKNKMDSRNLAIVFGSIMFGEDEIPRGGAELLNIGHAKDTVMEDMVNYAPLLFGERETEGSSPASSTFFHSTTQTHASGLGKSDSTSGLLFQPGLQTQNSGTTVKPDSALNKDAPVDELPDYAGLAVGMIMPLEKGEKGEKGGSASGHSARPSLREGTYTPPPTHEEKEVGKEKEKEKEREKVTSRDAPLPPEPAGETPTKVDYGSSHTLIRHPGVDPEFSPRLPEIDFAPRLPARPGKSIHPASRAAALNPERVDQPETSVAGQGQPPPASEAPTLPSRRTGGGAPSLDVRLPSPLPEVTLPRMDSDGSTPTLAPSSSMAAQQASVIAAQQASGASGQQALGASVQRTASMSLQRTPGVTVQRTPSLSVQRAPSMSIVPTPGASGQHPPSTPVRITAAGISSVKNSPIRTTFSAETESPTTAEFTTPSPSPLATRATPSRVVTSDDVTKEASPHKSGDTKRL